MNSKRKRDIRKLLGAYLKHHRENVLKIESVRQLSFDSNLDQSKLSKIEKGKIDIRIDTLMEVAVTYQIKPKELFNFEIDFWEKEAE